MLDDIRRIIADSVKTVSSRIVFGNSRLIVKNIDDGFGREDRSVGLVEASNKILGWSDGWSSGFA